MVEVRRQLVWGRATKKIAQAQSEWVEEEPLGTAYTGLSDEEPLHQLPLFLLESKALADFSADWRSCAAAVVCRHRRACAWVSRRGRQMEIKASNVSVFMS